MSEEQDRYWALEEADEVVSKLTEIRRGFIENLVGTELFWKIQRSHKYYYGLYHENRTYTDKAIKTGGTEAEYNLMDLNEYHSVISLLKTYITSIKPDWDTMAREGSHNALEATKASNELLDSYMNDNRRHLADAIRVAVKDSLVYGAGYVWNKWNENLGEEIDADPETGRVFHAGDYSFQNPHIFDVVYDCSVRDFRDAKWLLVRCRENKWELAEEYGEDEEEKQKILAAACDIDEFDDKIVFDLINKPNPESRLKDYSWVYYFYHVPTTLLPYGRYVKFIGDYVLHEDELPDGHIPVHRLVPEEYVQEAFGFTPAFNLQGPQEALNMISSTIITNQDKLGPTKLWFRAGEPINQADLEPGITVIQSETEPKPINFLHTPKELFSALDMYRGSIERLSGVNPTARGLQQSKQSGKAYQFLESRTEQSASDIINNYFSFLCDIGTSLLLGLKQRTEDNIAYNVKDITGKTRRKKLTQEMLSSVESVSVVVGNPLMRHMDGRVEFLNYLMGTGLIKTPEEFVTVLKTGNLDVLLEANDSQLQIIHAENDDMIAGEDVPVVAPEDHHVLHIRKHASLLNTPEIRKNTELVNRVHAHNALHLDLLKNIDMQELQVVLGYQTPIPPTPPPGMGNIPGTGVPGGPMDVGTNKMNLPGQGRNPPMQGGPPNTGPQQQ